MKKQSNILTIIRKELSRFFGDRRMVLTTVLLPGLMIYLLYSFMGDAIMGKVMPDQSHTPVIYVCEPPAMLKETGLAYTEISADQLDAVKQLIADKSKKGASAAETASASPQAAIDKADLLAVFPAVFDAAVAAYTPASETAAPNVQLFYNSSDTNSEAAYRAMSGALDAYERSLSNRFDINEGAGGDLASEKDTAAQMMSSFLPMLLMMFIYSGCMSVAPESIAGEKERGTIATLLITPMKRSELAIGKIISLTVIALLSGVSSFIGTILSLPKLMGADVAGINMNIYQPTDYLLLLCVILSTVLVLISAISIISAMASSVKEASTYVMPLMIIVMLIGVSGMLGNGAASSAMVYLIPLYNSVQCMVGILSLSYQPLNILTTIITNAVLAILLGFVLTRLFNSEKVMFSK